MLLLFSLAASPAAAAPLQLSPSSPWNVDYGEERCRLARVFGEGEDRTVLYFVTYGPHSGSTLFLSGRRARVAREEAIDYRFGPHEERFRDHRVLSGSLENGEPMLVITGGRIAPLTEEQVRLLEEARKQDSYFEFEPIEKERWAAVRSFEVTDGLPRDLVLETGALDKAFTVLEDCTWRLVEHWGFDVEQQKTLQRGARPKSDSHNWAKYIEVHRISLSNGVYRCPRPGGVPVGCR